MTSSRRREGEQTRQLPSLGPHFLPSRVGLLVRSTPSIDEWLSAWRKLTQAQRCILWWIGDLINYGERAYGERYSQALDVTGYDYQTLQDAVWVARKIEISRRRENLSWSYHKEVAGLEPDEQDTLLSKAETENWSRMTLREAVRIFRWQLRSGTNLGSPPFPDEKVRVILADPPWSFGNSGFHQAAASQYPTMSIDEICALPVKDLVLDQAALFLWVPNALMQDSKAVCQAWEFEYRINIVWCKSRAPGMGWYVKSKHEHLLLATRGEGMLPVEKVESWFQAEVTKHSRKPDHVYELIERMYPGPYLELFARREREGWKAWGNEIRGLTPLPESTHGK